MKNIIIILLVALSFTAKAQSTIKESFAGEVSLTFNINGNEVYRNAFKYHVWYVDDIGNRKFKVVYKGQLPKTFSIGVPKVKEQFCSYTTYTITTNGFEVLPTTQENKSYLFNELVWIDND